MLSNLWFDLNYAWRLLNKARGYSLLCTCVVALSVGLAIFGYSVLYGMVLKPLGFIDSERWYSVQMAVDATATSQPSVDAYTYQELLKHNRTVDYLGASSNLAATLSEGQASTRLRAAAISPRLLAATRVAPLMGRLFEDADSQSGAVPAVILSFAAWQTYFAGDPTVIGRQTRIDARPVQVIGVMPRDFYVFVDSEIWLPLQLPNLAKPDDSNLTLSPLFVLQKGQTVEAATNEVKTAVDAVNKNYPDLFNAARHVELIPAHRMYTHNSVLIAQTLSFVAAAVLLLGSVNLSLVFLARLLERSRELALRTALGASRSRLLRQCLLETAFVVLLGLLIGYGLAALGIRWSTDMANFAAQFRAQGRPPILFALRSSDLAIAVLAAMAVWLLSTLIPAWRITRQDAALVLAGSGKGVGFRGSSKGTAVLVGVQVIISCLVLVICTNMALAIRTVASKPTGIDAAQVMISTYRTLFDGRYADAAARQRYWDELTTTIQGRMANTQVAYATALPTEPLKVPVSIDSQEGATRQGTLTLPLTTVSDSYFKLLGIELRSGRLFDSTDDSAALDVAIIDENTAKRYWPSEHSPGTVLGDVLGKRIQLNASENGPWLTIVGVVAHVVGKGALADDSSGVVYRPLRQASPNAFHLLAKSPMSKADGRAALRAAAFAVDRDLPLQNLQMLGEYLTVQNLALGSLVPIFSVIAAITVILAATGLFGLISRSVAQRTQEVGVRRALGATKWQATSMFLRQGVLYLSVGIVGIGLGIVLTNLISALITNILDHVFVVTLGVLVLMAAVIFAASYLPTRRAVALEPGDALRYE